MIDLDEAELGGTIDPDCDCPECQPRIVVSSVILPTGPCRDCNCAEFIEDIDDPDFCLACNHHVAIHDREVNR